MSEAFQGWVDVERELRASTGKSESRVPNTDVGFASGYRTAQANISESMSGTLQRRIRSRSVHRRKSVMYNVVQFGT